MEKIENFPLEYEILELIDIGNLQGKTYICKSKIDNKLYFISKITEFSYTDLSNSIFFINSVKIIRDLDNIFILQEKPGNEIKIRNFVEYVENISKNISENKKIKIEEKYNEIILALLNLINSLYLLRNYEINYSPEIVNLSGILLYFSKQKLIDVKINPFSFNFTKIAAKNQYFHIQILTKFITFITSKIPQFNTKNEISEIKLCDHYEKLFSHKLFQNFPIFPIKTASSNYKIVQKICENHSRTLLLAKNFKNEQQYVLKIVNTNTEKSRNLIENEIKTYFLVQNCENVAKLFDFFTEIPNKICLIIEYFPYGDLESYIKKQKKIITVCEIYNICTKILNGLCEIHSKNIFHLDLRPRNIMISKISSENKRIEDVKIIDLGLSVINNPAKIENIVEKLLENEIEILRKLPESYMVGKFSVGGSKADIWNFGLTLFFIIFGKHADEYFCNKAENILLKGEILFPKKDDPDPFLLSIIKKCLNPVPYFRPTAQNLFAEFNFHYNLKFCK